MHEVISYLDRVDPAAAARARERYACLDHVAGNADGQAYGFAAAFGAGETCEDEVVEQLVDLQRHALEYARRDGLIADDELFYAEQNAKTVMAAAEHYRSMFEARRSSWNLRDQHMADTLDALAEHLGRQRAGRPNWSCGHTTPTLAMLARPRSPHAVRSTWANSCACVTSATVAS